MKDIQKMGEAATMDGDGVNEGVRAATQEISKNAQGTWNDLRTRGNVALRKASGKGEDLWVSFEELVGGHPAQAVGIALLVGLAAGALIRFGLDD